MTGLKSGAGDDLWGDDDSSDGDAAEEGRERTVGEAGTADASTGSADGAASTENGSDVRPYVVRRAIRDKPVQFERDERLTFFVHDDVAEGERELVSEVSAALGRDVPKFDVREAVYRAALRNREDVLAELLEMGYSLEEE